MRTTRFLLGCGIVASPLFILVFLLLGASRADYDPWRHAVSALSIGEHGWMQATNFGVTGLLLFCFALGVRRVLGRQNLTAGPVLLGLVAVGLMGAGFFVCDPMNGYPPGTPLVPTERSQFGRIHDLFGVPVFLGLPAACGVFSRWFAAQGARRASLYSALSGGAMFAAFVVAGMGFRQLYGLDTVAGLFQRLSIAIGWVWLGWLSLRFTRRLT